MRKWLKKCSVKEMLPTDAAWLAGLIDGEGTIGVYKNSNGHGGRFVQYTLQVVNTHVGALRRCRKISGVGSVNPKWRAKQHKPCWAWKVSSQRDIIAVLEQVLPHLTIKLPQARRSLRLWKDLS